MKYNFEFKWTLNLISSLFLFGWSPLDPNWLITAGLPWCRLPRRVFFRLLTNTNTDTDTNANINTDINIKTYTDTNENTNKKMMSCCRLPFLVFSLLETNKNTNTKLITNANSTLSFMRGSGLCRLSIR